MHVFNLVSLLLGKRNFPRAITIYLLVTHHRTPVPAASIKKCLKCIFTTSLNIFATQHKTLIPAAAVVTHRWQKLWKRGEISPRHREVET